MDNNTHPQDKQENNDELMTAIPKISDLVQRLPAEKEAPDVDGFIRDIKSESDLPSDISDALNEARSRIQMDIPDPPADLWDTELEDLEKYPGQTKAAFNPKQELEVFSEELSFNETLSAAFSSSDLKALDIAEENFESVAAATNIDETNDSPAELAATLQTALKEETGSDFTANAAKEKKVGEASKEPDETSGKPGTSEDSSATGQTAATAESTEKKPSEEEKDVVEESPSGIAELTDEEKAKQEKKKINPWSLFFGKNNLVDATATLIFMHAVLLLGLELMWKRMPVEFMGYNKNGFLAFVVATAGIQVLTLLFPMFLSFNTYRLPSGTVVGKTQIDRPMTLASLLLGVPAALFFNGINNLFTYLIISWDLSLPSNILPSWSRPDGILQLFITIMVAAVVPSILEELFFRGFLMKSLYGLGGKKAAIFLSALAFAFFHNDPLFLIGPFGVGLLLGYLRKNTESVLPAILTHLSINVSTFLLDPVLPRFNTQMVLLFPAEGRTNLTANVVATVSSGIVLFFIYRFINTNLVKSRAYTGFTTGRRASIYGRNQVHKEAVLASPDRHYKVPPVTLGNYIRFFIACGIWIFSRFLS